MPWCVFVFSCRVLGRLPRFVDWISIQLFSLVLGDVLQLVPCSAVGTAKTYASETLPLCPTFYFGYTLPHACMCVNEKAKRQCSQYTTETVPLCLIFFHTLPHACQSLTERAKQQCSQYTNTHVNFGDNILSASRGTMLKPQQQI